MTITTKTISFVLICCLHIKWKWIPKYRSDVGIYIVRNGLDEANVTLKLQNVAGHGLKNTHAKKALDGLENVEQHRFKS